MFYFLDKLPTKGSLKRRRLLQENLSKRDKNYTDDIFDERTFYSLTDVDEVIKVIIYFIQMTIVFYNYSFYYSDAKNNNVRSLILTEYFWSTWFALSTIFHGNFFLHLVLGGLHN